MEPKTFCMLMAAVYGFFGVTLYGNANFFWGPDSVFSYFEESCFQGQFFGRALGLMFTSVVLGPFVFGVDPMALPLARYRHDVAKYRPDAARDGPGF